MSYSLSAYVRREQVPSGAALNERLRQAGARLELNNVGDLTSHRGFLPVKLDGQLTGFELYSAEITDKDRAAHRKELAIDGETTDELLEILVASNFEIGVMCAAKDARELAAARLFTRTIAQAAGGWFSDPQTGETTRYGG